MFNHCSFLLYWLNWYFYPDACRVSFTAASCDSILIISLISTCCQADEPTEQWLDVKPQLTFYVQHISVTPQKLQEYFVPLSRCAPFGQYILYLYPHVSVSS